MCPYRLRGASGHYCYLGKVRIRVPAYCLFVVSVTIDEFTFIIGKPAVRMKGHTESLVLP